MVGISTGFKTRNVHKYCICGIFIDLSKTDKVLDIVRKKYQLQRN